jgi:hypothetical protein
MATPAPGGGAVPAPASSHAERSRRLERAVRLPNAHATLIPCLGIFGKSQLSETRAPVTARREVNATLVVTR